MASRQSARPNPPRLRRRRSTRIPRDAPSPPLAAVMLLSSAAIGYEVLLTRLFSIIQWHHFAYMMISVALLGYGAAGTFVALAQRVLLPRFDAVFAGGAVLFGITTVAGFALAQRVAFNPLEILWDPAQPLRLLVIYGLLFVPFFCAATSVCLTFTRFADATAPDLQLRHPRCGRRKPGHAGRALPVRSDRHAEARRRARDRRGSTGALPRRDAAAPARCRAARRCRSSFRPPSPRTGSDCACREYKELSQTLRIDGTRIVAERSSPLGARHRRGKRAGPAPARAGHEPQRDDWSHRRSSRSSPTATA